MELTGQYRIFIFTIITFLTNSFVDDWSVDAGRGINSGRCTWIKCRSATQQCAPGYFVAKMRPCRRRPERTQLRCCPLNNNTVEANPDPTLLPTTTSGTTNTFPTEQTEGTTFTFPTEQTEGTTFTFPTEQTEGTTVTFPTEQTEGPPFPTEQTEGPLLPMTPPSFNTPSTSRPQLASTTSTEPINIQTVEPSGPDTTPQTTSSCQKAEPDEFPYTVALIEIRPGQSSRHFCGGAILNENYVLTSAECINGRTNTIIASAGDLNLNLGDQQEQRVLVQRAIPHPDYNPSQKSNNIAVLRLKWSFTFNEHVNNITIAPSDYNKDSGMGTHTGWEEVEIYSNKGDPNLQKSDVSFVSYDDCSAAYDSLNCETQMCTSSTACPCDAGSPLVCPEQTRDGCDGDYLCGIVASPPSRKKRGDGPPIVSTFVPYYSEWIQQAMDEDSKEEASSSTSTSSSQSTTETLVDSTTLGRPDGVPVPTPNPPGPTLTCEQEDITSYPFTVALVRQSKDANTHFCGGTIIDEQYVLTGAHCFFNPKTFQLLNTSVLAIAGTTDLNEFPTAMQIIRVENIIIHEDYNPMDKSQYADIALIKLAQPGFDFDNNKYVQPAKLTPPGYDTNKGSATVVGWEVIELYTNNGQNSKFQRVTVKIIPDKQCSLVHRLFVSPNGKEKVNPDSQICVESDESHSACPGESGGPLICTGNFVCGLLSIISDYNGVPTVYTDVSPFKSWIQNKMTSEMTPIAPSGPDDDECDNETETGQVVLTTVPPLGPDDDCDNETETGQVVLTTVPPFGPDDDCDNETETGQVVLTTVPPLGPDDDCDNETETGQVALTTVPPLGPDDDCDNETETGQVVLTTVPPLGPDDDCDNETETGQAVLTTVPPLGPGDDNCDNETETGPGTGSSVAPTPPFPAWGPNMTDTDGEFSNMTDTDDEPTRCSDAPRNKFPHVIAIIFQEPTRSKSSHICSGSIIDENWVITSASCFINPQRKQSLPLENLLISAGDFDLNILDGSEQICQVENVFFPDCYDPSDSNQLCNIAAVKLLWPITFNPFVQPIKLPPSGRTVPLGSTGITTGWDIKELNTYSGNSILQSISLPILPCPTRYYGKKPQKSFIGSQMCAATRHRKRGSECPLDIGAGLLCKFGNLTTLCGVASSTTNTARSIFHIYTSILFFKQWLDSTITGTVMPTGTTTEMSSVTATMKPGDPSESDVPPSWLRCVPGRPVPYQVSLFRSDPETRKLTYFCAGIIFNEQTVITAANCLYKNAETVKLELIRIFAGGADLSNHSTLQILQPDRILPHEKYELTNPMSIDNIGLIKTTFPFVWNEYVSPAKVPPIRKSKTYNMGVIGGWDIDDLYSNSAKTVYQEITIPILPDIECIQYAPSLHPESQMCTYSRHARIPNECGGIPGGPLVCEEYACGINLGSQPGRGNGIIGPGIFTELAYYYKWLDGVTNSPTWLDNDKEDTTPNSGAPVNPSGNEDAPNSWQQCDQAPTISIPIQVALIINLPGSITNLHFCDGAIMAENLILTSAACLFTPQTLVPIATAAITAIAGEYNLNIFEGTEQIVDIAEYYIHENFDINNSSLFGNLAVLRTGSPFTFNEYVQPIKFPPSDGLPPTSGSIAGWDVEELYTDVGNPILRRLTMPIISEAQCLELFEPLLPVSQFCASLANGKRQGGDSSCGRFGGGPFMCGNYVCGITSSSSPDQKDNRPYIITKLLHFYDWIRAYIDVGPNKKAVRTTTSKPNIRRTTTNMINKHVLTTRPTVSTLETGTSKCSIAQQTSFQHQVAIVHRFEGINVYTCSGTIMNEFYIITAASCLYSTSGHLIPLSELFIFAGDPNLNEIDGSEQIIRINEVIIHENYDKNDPIQFCNLALLRVKWSIVFNEFVNSATPFQYHTNKIKGRVDVSGWGPPTQLFTGNDKTLLRKSTERVVPCDGTNSSLKDAAKAILYSPSQVCIFSSTRGNSCPRDIGSGMFCDNGKFICGVASSSSHPFRTYNNIYTSLPFFRSWILSKMKHSTNLVATPSVGTTSSPKPDVVVKCRDADQQEFQFQVSLISLNSRGGEKVHFCDGSLLSESYVLTAASCLFNEAGQQRNIKHILVSAGDPNPSTSGLQITQVEKAILHDNFDVKSSAQNYNIALLKLKWPITINEYTATIALPSVGLNSSNVGEGFATAAGRENLDTRYEGNSNLRVSHLKLKSCNGNRKTNPHFIQGREKIPSTICTTDDNRLNGICPRDVGGPLICNDEARGDQYICGVAVPISQTLHQVSSTFSSVTYHRSWIENKLTGKEVESVLNHHLTFENHQASACVMLESSFPYQVALIKTEVKNNNYIHFCDAVIYSAEYVLTTASCVQTEDMKNMWVFAGYADLNKLPTSSQILKIEKIIVHESYDKFQNYADIALLKLSQKLVFNEYISEAKFTTSLSTNGIISGWKTKQLYSDNENEKSSFQKTTVPIVRMEHCVRKEGSYNLDSQICVAVSKRQDSCVGTKGGPLSEIEDNDRAVFGIASGSPLNSHMVFTKIYYFQDWIYEQTAATSFGTSSLVSRPAAMKFSCMESNAMTFPFQVALTHLGQSKPQHFCSGVIYNTTIVLTAAHCMFNPKTKKLYDPRYIRTIAGDTDINKLDGTEQVVSVRKFIIHPHYNPGTAGTSLAKNDIAMIILKSPLKENEYTKSIRVPEHGLPVASHFATIAGWQNEQSSKSVLHLKRVPIISYDECKRKLRKELDRNMYICTVSDRTCKGDDGGPLVVSLGPVRKPTSHLLYGISTFVSKDASLPNIYTNIAYYLKWIDGSKQSSKVTFGTSSLDRFQSTRLRSTPKPISALFQEQHSSFQNCRPAGRNSFPFQVALVLKSDNKSTHFCGGTLIAKRYVLTSASCILDKLDKFSDVYVFAGDNDLSKLDGSEQVIKVDEVTIHEDFDPNGSNQYFDLALLRLKWAVTVNAFVNVIELPPSEMNSSSISGGTTGGWNIIDLPSGPGNPILHVKEVTNISSCSRFYLPTKNFNTNYEETQFCSGSENNEFSSSCPAEFGAPLVCSYNSNNYICGVAAYSSSSTKRNWDVFTDVPYFRAWIEEMMQTTTNGADTNKPRKSNCLVAEKASFNFQVALIEWDPESNTHSHFCSGNIISRSLLLTAAHCWFDERTEFPKDVKYVRGLAGDHDLNKLEGTEIITKIEKVLFHQNYKPEEQYQLWDIAVVKLKTPLVFDKFISSIALPKTEQFTINETGKVAGWDEVELFTNNANSILQTVDMKMIPYEKCSAQFGESFKVDSDLQLCLVPANETQSTCRGDFGGGYICESNGEKHLCGLGSVFYDGNLLPRVYTNVSYFTSWIAAAKNALVTENDTLVEEKPVETANFSFPIKKVPTNNKMSLQKCEVAKPKSWPFQVALVEKHSNLGNRSHFCGGAILTSEYIITSASCMFDTGTKNKKMAKNIMVHGGESNINVNEGNEQKIQAKKIFIHGNFDPMDSSKHSDIALIRLRSGFNFNAFVAQAPELPPRDFDMKEFKSGKVGGWEEVDLHSHKGSPLLRTVEYQIIDDKECEQSYKYFVPPRGELKIYPDMHICAADGGNAQTCRGDLGGPMICNGKKSKYLCGVASINNNKVENVPHLYTDIAYFRNWIEWITQY